MHDEIKAGSQFWYKLDPKSGFWINQLPADPMSATVTFGELKYMIKDAIEGGLEMITKISSRINELNQFVEYHEKKEAEAKKD